MIDFLFVRFALVIQRPRLLHLDRDVIYPTIVANQPLNHGGDRTMLAVCGCAQRLLHLRFVSVVVVAVAVVLSVQRLSCGYAHNQQ